MPAAPLESNPYWPGGMTSDDPRASLTFMEFVNMATQRLNQVIAVENGLKTQTEAELTKSYHTLQKPALFEGMTRTYRPLNAEGDKVPAEHRKVQHKATNILGEATARLMELFDATATKDWANCSARASVTLDGEVVVADAPVTFLLFLEKQLLNVRTLINHTPVLDPAEEWHHDVNDGLYKTDKLEKVRTQKVQRPIVLYAATKEHPAQTQLINEDVTIGFWEEQKISGAVPQTFKQAGLARVERLMVAVKKAREEANLQEAPPREVGVKILRWLFDAGPATGGLGAQSQTKTEP